MFLKDMQTLVSDAWRKQDVFVFVSLLSKATFAVTVILLCLAVVSSPGKEQPFSLVPADQGAEEDGAVPGDSFFLLRSAEEYRTEFQKKELFSTLRGRSLERMFSGAVTGSGKSLSSVGNLKLVGIIFDPAPQAIIEDAGTGQSFFVSEGDLINEVRIDLIENDRVIFIHKGNKGELVQ